MKHCTWLSAVSVGKALVWLLAFTVWCSTAHGEADEAQSAIQAIKRLGGKVRRQGQAWEVDFHLRGRGLTDDDLVHVAKIPSIGYLNLSRTKITGDGLRHLRKLTTLRRLHLEQTEVDDRGIAELVGLRKLEYLNVYGTQVTDQSLDVLAQLPELQRLYVWQTAVTADGVAKLQKRRPRMKIVRGTDLSSLPSTFPKGEQAKPPKLSLEWVGVSGRAEVPARSENGVNVQ
ncbi:MAG: hypothetical protein CL681_20635, partial [Blastopirellula sp.]|nr:hypothetical protein [Blastopirellula sp.]